jgi:hypothetical protein
MPSTQEPSRGTHAAGELREIVGQVQPIERLVPQAAVHQVVPLGNQVVDRATGGHAADELAGLAERYAAIHAARALLAQMPLFHVMVELAPVAHTLRRRAIDRQLAQVLDEAGRFTHLRSAVG